MQKVGGRRVQLPWAYISEGNPIKELNKNLPNINEPLHVTGIYPSKVKVFYDQLFMQSISSHTIHR